MAHPLSVMKHKFGAGPMKQQDKGQQGAAENVERMKRFGSHMKEKGQKSTSTLERIRGFAASESERKKKQEEEARKKKNAAPPKSTEPARGFFGRMYDKYVGGKKEGS